MPEEDSVVYYNCRMEEKQKKRKMVPCTLEKCITHHLQAMVRRIRNSMLQNLPEGAKQQLLKMKNKCSAETFFPNVWRQAIVCPIVKPNKDPSLPSSYRPIALTSSLCKIMERLINNRLLDYLERIPNFCNIQCGGLKGWSTTDYLIQLESVIRKGFVNSEYLIAIFMNFEKAYDLTWKHGIMLDLHRLGLRGRLPMYIQQFL